MKFGVWRSLLLLSFSLFPLLLPAQDALPSPLPPRIRPIVSPGGIRPRLAALRSLRHQTLLPAETDALWTLLAQTPEQAGLPIKDLNHLRNDVLDLLVHHTPVLPDLVPRLCAMYRDKSQDRTWRDYCIQFLGQAYPAASETDRELALAAIHEAAAVHTVPTAGTALIALSNNLSAPGIDRDRLAQLAVALAADPDASPGARMTAFAVCARLEAAEALPHARAAAHGDTAQSVNVRMAAIAAIGTLGDHTDREPLAELAKSAETRIRRAALTALDRLGRASAETPPR